MENNVEKYMTMEDLVQGLSKFENIDDRVKFAKAHPKVKGEFLIGKSEEFLRYWDFILKWWGSSFLRIDNSCRENNVNSGDLVEMAVKFCPDLEVIQLMITEDCIEKVAQNLSKLKKLKNIHILDVLRVTDDCNNSNINELFMSFQCLSNLRCLKLETGALTTDEAKTLNKVIQLEELDIYLIKDDNFNDLSTLLEHLRVLKIQNCSGIIPYCPKLTNLAVFDAFPNFCRLDREYNTQLRVLNIGKISWDDDVISRLEDLVMLDHLIFWQMPSDIDVFSRIPARYISTPFPTDEQILRLEANFGKVFLPYFNRG